MEDEVYDYPEDFESAGEEDDQTKMRESRNMAHQRLYNRNLKFHYGQSKCSFISNQEDTSSYDELIPYQVFKGVKSTDDEQILPKYPSKNSSKFYSIEPKIIEETGHKLKEEEISV
jgi:hypothetical protein